MTFDTDKLELPKDRVTMNATNRFYYRTNITVGDAINRHTIESLSGSKFVDDGKIRFIARDDKSQPALDALNEKRNLLKLVSLIANDYWLLGEVFPYTDLETYPDVGAMTIINPDQIRVGKTEQGQDKISLRDPVSKTEDAVDQPEPQSISHLKMLASPYDIRGTSVIVSVYEDLERLRSGYFAKEIRQNDGDQAELDTMESMIREKLMFGDEATRQQRYSDFRIQLIAWFEKITNQVPELAGSTIRFE